MRKRILSFKAIHKIIYKDWNICWEPFHFYTVKLAFILFVILIVFLMFWQPHVSAQILRIFHCLLLYNYNTLFEKITLNSSSLLNLYYIILMWLYFVDLFIIWIYLFISLLPHVVAEIGIIIIFLIVHFHWFMRFTNCRSSQCICKSFHFNRTLSNTKIICSRVSADWIKRKGLQLRKRDLLSAIPKGACSDADTIRYVDELKSHLSTKEEQDKKLKTFLN